MPYYFPISLGSVIFIVYTLWVVSNLSFSTQNHPPELQMVSDCQLNIYIWMPCKYVKAHNENLSIAVILTHSNPHTCSLPRIPYLVEEYTTHHTVHIWTLEIFLDSSFAFTPPVSHQVLTVLPACYFMSLFSSACHCHYLKTSSHCFILQLLWQLLTESPYLYWASVSVISLTKNF